MSRLLHVRAKAGLWCAGLAVATNGALGLLLVLRAAYFPPLAFLNMYVTLALALGPVCLLPSTLLQSWRPGITAAAHAGRPRGRDLLALALGLLVVLACVMVMAHFVGVAEDPLRRMVKEGWPPDRFRTP